MAGYVTLPVGIVGVLLLTLCIWDNRLSPHITPCLLEDEGLQGSFEALEGIRWLAAMHIYAFHPKQRIDACCGMYSCHTCQFGKYEVLLFFVISRLLLVVAHYRRPNKGGGLPPCHEPLTHIA